MPSTSNVSTELVFENEFCEHFAANGWCVRTHMRNAKSYSRELAIVPGNLITFMQETRLRSLPRP